jgi:glycosyltransferase involved in cell wall biosynthesis
VIVSFVAPSQPVPMGGVTAIYEFANGLARRGHEVHIAHGRFWGRGITSLDEIAWFDFEPGIHHHLDPGTGVDLPDGDVIFGTEAPRRMGLPVLLVQGLDMFPKEMEHQAFRTPGLKVCVASWLIDAGLELGVPREQLVHVPMGIDHGLFRVRTPIQDRAACVGLLHNDHPAKGWRAGLAALERVHERVPDAETIVFSQQLPSEPLPEWVEAVEAPTQTHLAEHLYDRCSVFLQSSVWEGFGFTAVEAMACGCALVTTDNGGSRDYALPGRTALVSAPKDEVALADSVERLLTDDALRIRLAEAGAAHVRFQFDWDRAGALLEEHLQAYVAEPERYLRPAIT